MVEISAAMVKELRDKSGAAMMDCKKALVESGGDSDKAFEWLRQKGVATASKKALRAASEGLVAGKVAADGNSAVLLEVNCETDFVARNPEFVSLVSELADLALEHKACDVESLVKLPHAAGTVQDLITERVAKTGENILIRRASFYELGSSAGVIGLYVHAVGGKMGALVQLKAEGNVSGQAAQSLAKELAMHIVSSKPQYVSRTEIPAEVIDNERRIESGKADLADKKPEIREKIVSGRVDKIFSERCLLDQPFVKDPSQTVAKYLKSKAGDLKVELTPVRFVLFVLGESTADAESERNGSS